MKNITPFGRLLLLAVFLLSYVGLSAQQSCNLDPNLIEITVKNTCTDGGALEQPYVTIDFGSTAIDGMTEITIESIFFGNTNLGTYTFPVQVSFGFTTFKLPGFALPTPSNFVRLNEVEDLETGCVQTFGAGDVESNFYSLTTTSAITITKSNNRSINPPCGNIPTGKLSIRVRPNDGNTSANRFSMSSQDVRLVPSTFATFISIIPPGTSPNPTQPNSANPYYIIETNQSLVSGNYTFLVFDNVRGCEVAFETVVGDPANDFDVMGQPAPVSCFGTFDGSIKIIPQNANPSINGFLNYTLTGPNGLQRTGTIAANGGVYNMPTESNLEAGNYTLTLTASGGGCTGTDMITIGGPDEIIVSNLMAGTICANSTDVQITASAITGVDANTRYRFIDASRLDPNVSNNDCWSRPDPTNAPPFNFLLTDADNGDGTYSFNISSADIPSCRSIDQDTTVTLVLELRNPNPNNCRDTFMVNLQINAQPETPDVSLIAMNATGNPVGASYCSNQDVTVSIDNYPAAGGATGFTYVISYMPVPGVTGTDDFTNLSFTYTGPGSVVGSFNNTTNSQQTMNFTATATNDATGCVSQIETFSIPVRPLPVVDLISPNTANVCSRETYTSPAITLNGNGGNANVRFRYLWTLNNASADFSFLANQNNSISGSGLTSGTTVNGRFRNVTGVAQTATLTITPVFPQPGGVGNDCDGASRQITVTISPRPSLNYDLTIGDLDTMLTSPNVASFEICNGEDFLLNNLAIPETNASGKLKYVRYRVRGDARFLQINPNNGNGNGFGPNAIQTTQFLPIGNFAIGQPNIQNNHPTNNAQVAQIILTPYYQTPGPGAPANLAASQMCAGQPIRLFLTVNPTPPTLNSPQADTVCSNQRIEYPIMGASGSGTTLETRITETNVFPGTTDATFTVPEGANRIENFRFELTGGNGGGNTNGGVGGLGTFVTGSLSSMQLLPGDVVRIRKGLAGVANSGNGKGGDATFLTVTAGSNHVGITAGDVIQTFVAAGGGGAGSAQNGRNGRNFIGNSTADGMQGQGPGGFGGTGFINSSVSRGGNGNVQGGGGGGGYAGGNGGRSQIGESGQGGTSFSSTAGSSSILKTDTQLASGQARIFYTVVYDDIRFSLASMNVPNGLLPMGESIVDGEVDTILFGQQFENTTNGALTVSYVFNTSTEAMCENGSQVTVNITIEPKPALNLISGTTTITGNATDGYAATVCSRDGINAVLQSETTTSDVQDSLYFIVSNTTTQGTGFRGSLSGRASNPDGMFGGNNTGDNLDISFFENRVVNNTGSNGTIVYTITPFINNNGMDCQGDDVTFTVTVLPGFPVDDTQPVVNVCSREELNTVFNLDMSQDGDINVVFDDIRLEDFRVGSSSTDFTFSGIDTSGLAAGGVDLDRTGNFFNDLVFTNRTGGGVSVEIDVVFISGDGCESIPVTYSFNSRAEPIIDESVTTITVCEGEAIGIVITPTALSAFDNNFAPNDITFSYVLDAGALTYTGALPSTGGTLYGVSGAGVGAFRIQNDAFANPTSTPQTATYTVVATSKFSCASQPVTYTVTVEPSPELTVTASQGDSTITGQVLLADIDTISICSGSTVDFALSQDVTGADVSYRIQRIVTGTATNGDGSPIDNFEGGLPVGGFQEMLANAGTSSATVQYNLEVYTYGRNGLDDNGLAASDDCRGVTKRLIIEVLPATTDEASLVNNITINSPNVVSNNPGNGAQICDNSEVFIRPVTTIDPTTGAAFVWRRENDGTLLGGAVSGSGDFNTTQNVNNVYPAPNADRIQQVLTALDDQTTEVRYIVTLYSFGTDGVNDMLAPGSDDCMGDIDTVTLQLDPTPVLTADLEIGTAPVASLNAAGSTYTYEICDGEDFLLDNLAFPETANGKVKYVDFQADGDIDFLGLNGSSFQTVAPVGNFSLGAQNIQNTSGNAQTATLLLIPYFEDGTDDTTRDPAECAGEIIRIIVTINPMPPVLGPFTETVCSEERVEYQIPGASNQFISRVAGSTTFDTSNDFVVPVGAAGIIGVNISVSGANGGNTGTNRGGLGGVVETSINPPSGMMNPTLLFPGDTVRVRKGVAGANGATNGGGGDATMYCIIAGPSPQQPVAQGMIVETLLAGGGGGAGFAEVGADAGAEQVDPASNGGNGDGLGGFGGTGWNAMNPPAGSLGGAGRGNGGGGGGGWNGGDGGSNVNGLAGGFGTSYSGVTIGPSVNADFSTKAFNDAAGGTVTMDYILVYDDVRFDVVSRNVGNGLIDISDNPIVSGETDTILYGERFDNPTDAPVDVVYTFSTSSEANCPGGQVVVTLTVEPTPILDLASNGTMITDNGDGSYTADICSGDSLSAVMSSMTLPSQGTNVVRARILSATPSSPDVTFGTGNGDEVSAPGNFGGNNQPSTADIPFYEASINNVGTTNGTVTYIVVPYIINTVGTSGTECVGDTMTLTVTVYPEVITVNQGPIMNNICSNGSLEDAGFDLDASQPMVQIAFDSIIIDTVINNVAGVNAANFDTISSLYNGTPVTVIRSAGFFNADTYRNRTGGPVVVTYKARLVSGPGCTSDTITYEFRYYAEPVIDIVESPTNQIDTTICSGDMTGLIVTPAANSAFPGTAPTGPTSFQANIDLAFSINLNGAMLTKANGSYPNTTGGRAFMRDDVLTNNTASPIDVTYTVKPTNSVGCAGDSVVYTVTVNPNPFAEVMLTSLDSTETFGLNNSRLSVSPNPQFGLCSGQALTATVPAVSAIATGTLMVNFEVSIDADGISGYPATTTYTFPASQLADSLSYAAGELVNLTNADQFFTVEYRAFIDANGTPGYQNDGVDCLSDGIIQFDVVVSPTNGAIARTELDGQPGPIAAGMDTLCSGDVFDFFVRNSDVAAIAVNRFFVTVIDTGLDTVGTTPTDTFSIVAANTASAAVRLQDFSYTNNSAGIKTVTYIVIPFSAGCAGVPDTTTISYRPQTVLELDEPVICAQSGVGTFIFPVDENGQTLSTANNQYRYRYIGGTASGFSLTRANGNNFTFIGDPVNQANTITYNNERRLIVTPAGSFVPGVVNFQVLLRNTPGGCSAVLDTLTLELSANANAGTLDPSLDVLCDGINFLLSDALMDESEGGVFTDANNVVQSGGNYTPMIGGSNPAPVAVSFTYTVGGGNSGCAVVTNTFTLMVEPAPNAGTLNSMASNEACQSALSFNLFDIIDGAMPGGTFTQTAGVDFITVASDGVFNQNSITAGTYIFEYEVTSANGCGSDVLSGITVEVLAQIDCSTVVPCDTITLLAGFNVISFDALPSDVTVENIFADEIAANNLLSIFTINPDTRSSEVYTYNPLFGTTNNTIGSIKDGLGYIVEVDQATTIITCGMAADTSLRVELISGLNIVGYTKPELITARNYFSTVIANGDVNQIRTVTEAGVFQRLRFNPLRGSNIRMTNSRGYLLDITADYAANSWRDDEQMPTSNFDRLFGYTNIGSEFAGQYIRFVDAEGNVYGKVAVDGEGTYDNMILYGDLDETERLVEGPAAGEELFAEFRGETIATGMTFNGGWALRQLDLNFSATTPVVEQVGADAFAMEVFPNPTADIANVRLTLAQDYQTVRVEVYGMMGQLVMQREVTDVRRGQQVVELDLSKLPAGTYRLLVFTDGEAQEHRQVIRR